MNNRTWIDYRKEEVITTAKSYTGYCSRLDYWMYSISKRLMEIVYDNYVMEIYDAN